MAKLSTNHGQTQIYDLEGHLIKTSGIHFAHIQNSKAYIGPLLCAFPTSNAFVLRKYNALFSVKTFKTKGHLGVCSIWNTLNLENVCGKNLWLCPFTELSICSLMLWVNTT